MYQIVPSYELNTDLYDLNPCQTIKSCNVESVSLLGLILGLKLRSYMILNSR